MGFVFRAEGVRMAFATDLGYIPPNVKAQLQGVDLLLLESNHDLEMLRDGPYPWAVKQRVLSRVGHLSNEAAAEYLENGYDGQAAYVILAHLSESNNLPELARVTAERALNGRASLLANRLLLASQHEPLSSYQFLVRAGYNSNDTGIYSVTGKIGTARRHDRFQPWQGRADRSFAESFAIGGAS